MTTVAQTPSFRQQITQPLRQVATSRLAWFFAALWLASAGVLVVSGPGVSLFSIGYGLALLLFSLVTVAITQPNPASHAVGTPRSRLWLQVAVVVVFIILTAWRGLTFHGVMPSSPGIPVWSSLLAAVSRTGDQWFGNGNYLVNPLSYFVLPLIVLLGMGASWRSLGFQPGHRMGRVLLLWCGVPALAAVIALLGGQMTVGILLARLVSNFMQNGFFEEFLFRGALQTRLRPLMGPGWALVLQALLFGVWHLGLGFTTTGHSGLLPALAVTVVNQGVMGLAFGVIFERTRNLLAPSIVHIVVNSLG